MLVIKVELWSAITGQQSEIARMAIWNSGDVENPNRGDYTTATFRGRDSFALARSMDKFFKSRDIDIAYEGVVHKGKVENHARLREHVWNLVAKCLDSMNYGKKAIEDTKDHE